MEEATLIRAGSYGLRAIPGGFLVYFADKWRTVAAACVVSESSYFVTKGGVSGSQQLSLLWSSEFSVGLQKALRFPSA